VKTPYTSYQSKGKLNGRPDRAGTRANAGLRFRSMQADAGLSNMQTAKLFQVTPRTVQNWRAGTTSPPGVVVHLLRIRSRWQVPCAGWEGWRFHSGKLWTPEGHAIGPQDGSWWSLLVRQARGFRAAYHELHQLRQELRSAWLAGYLEPSYDEAWRSAEVVALARPLADGTAEVGSGLVPSINKANTGDITSPEIQANQGLAPSTVEAHTWHQTDHGLISCPTRSDSLPSLTQRPANDASGWESASMPSSRSPSMRTCDPRAVQPPSALPRPRRHASSGSPSGQSQPLHLAGSSPASMTGASGTTPTCGPLSIPSSSTAGKASIRRTKPPAPPSKLSTGAPANDRRADQHPSVSTRRTGVAS
jgi:hypothetical protein